ncbi:RICIN domain-containing protein [Streptomyces laculatispora]|uniref:RICIN domain-containing protein n=1 Tax=Streptomyces laculatispora TaxID=887464 RepID=A0ABY9HZN8_9ACTN|nr:RICIN domain-containing protein [Streptomyces laculatispora]WLQ39879.1 RICIN domain-containing protein [Streptomyces laculatispora]
MSTAQTEAGGESFAPEISTVAGTGVAGFKGDNELAVAAQLNRPYGIALDSTGSLYFSDYNNHRVRKISTDGKISTVAGAGPGYRGDGGPAVSALLNCPREVAVDAAGSVYVTDAANHRVRVITRDGKIDTVAGTGTAGFSGDGGPAAKAQLNYPLGVAVDSSGALYISDHSNNRVRKVSTDGKISTVAGTGVAGFKGDDGPAALAQLNRPYALALDDADVLYITDGNNHRVRKVVADGTISTVAGKGTAGFSGDGGPATSAQLNLPLGVVVDSAGILYISDYNNHRVRKVAPDGKITTFAGKGSAGFGGDGGPAAAAQLNNPFGLAVDCVDTLYIADHVNNRVRKVASEKMAGLPESGTVVSWANVRSRLRMGVLRESTKDGAEIHQSLASPRAHQRWRLIASGQADGEVLYRIENVRSGKVLEVVGGGTVDGAVVVQCAYEGSDADHQQWKLIPVGSVTDAPRVYEIANRNSGLLLRVDTNAPAVVKQYGAQGDHRDRQWQLLPV